MASTPRPPALPEKKAPTTRAEKKADKKANRVLPSWLPESRKTKERKAKAMQLNKDIAAKRNDPKKPPVRNPFKNDSNDPKERKASGTGRFAADIANMGYDKAKKYDNFVKESKAKMPKPDYARAREEMQARKAAKGK